MGRLIIKMSSVTRELLFATKPKVQRKLHQRIQEYEELSDHLEEEIANYLVKVAEGRLLPSASITMRSILSIINDLERIADFYYQMSQEISRKNSKGISFDENQMSRLNEMFMHIDEAMLIMRQNLNSTYQKVSLKEALEKEKSINLLKYKFRKSHLKSIERKEYDWKNGIVYNELFNHLEKIGNHILDVSEAIAGHISRDEEDLPQAEASE